MMFYPNIGAGTFKFFGPYAKLALSSSAFCRLSKSMSLADGVIEKKTAGQITSPTTSETITFTDGFLDFGGRSRITGSYSVNPSPKISLAAAQSVVTEELGFTPESVSATGAGCSFTGLASFSSDITLTTAGTDLTLTIPGKCNANVALGGGTLKLGSDLRFADGKSITGTGTVQFQGNTIAFGGQNLTFASAITWQDASDIQLNSKTTLTSTWTFSGPSVINGNGNVLSITGGTIAIASGSVLYITDTYIKGVNFTLTNTTSELRLSNVTIEMNASKTFTTGKVFIEGECTIITKSNTMTFSSASLLTVDGATLWYDTQGSTDTTNISPQTAGTNLTLSNNGVILEKRAYRSQLATIGSQLATIDTGPGNITFTGATTLTYDLFLRNSHKLNLNGSFTLDGGGHKIRMATGFGDLISLQAGALVTITNAVIEDFQTGSLSLGSGARLTFGSGCTVKLAPYLPGTFVYPVLDKIIYLSGNACVDGSGGVYNTSAVCGIVSTSTNGAVLRNIHIVGVNANTSLGGELSTHKLVLDGVTLTLGGDFSFSTGYFYIESGGCKIRSTFKDSLPKFTYTSTATSWIRGDLVFEGTTFRYAPGSAAQNLLNMNSGIARLRFNSGNLQVSTVGLQLTTGTLALSGQVGVSTDSSTPATGLILGDGVSSSSNCKLDLAPGAVMNITSGVVNYNNV